MRRAARNQFFFAAGQGFDEFVGHAWKPKS